MSENTQPLDKSMSETDQFRDGTESDNLGSQGDLAIRPVIRALERRA